MSADCVILAAGLSIRMGQNKLSLELGGKTLIERCVDAYYAICQRIVVVTGAYEEDVRRCLKSYERVFFAHNDRYERGMFSSVKVGIRHVESERFFLTPGDYPRIRAETIENMLKASGRAIVPVYHGKRGHPVLVDHELIPAIVSSGSASLRDCLSDFSPIEYCVDDIGIIADVDTREDYHRWCIS